MRAVEQSCLFKRGNVGVDTAILAAECTRERRDGRLWVCAQVAQQAIALAGHDGRKAFPAFERQHALVDALAAFRAVPDGKKRRSIVLDATPDKQLRRVRALSINDGARGGARGGRRGSPR